MTANSGCFTSLLPFVYVEHLSSDHAGIVLSEPMCLISTRSFIPGHRHLIARSHLGERFFVYLRRRYAGRKPARRRRRQYGQAAFGLADRDAVRDGIGATCVCRSVALMNAANAGSSASG